MTAHAGDWFAPLSKTDVAMVAADTGLLVVDWGRTRYIAGHPASFHETNTILGYHPSVRTVNTYFGTAISLYWLTAWALPPKEDHGYKRFINREYFSIVLGVREGTTIRHNASVGVGVRF